MALQGMTPRVAVVHDWLVTYGGAERVLENIADIFPGSDLFVSVDFLADHPIREKFNSITPSFIQSLPRAAKWYWYYACLMPLAFEQFDLARYDVIISSSHAFAKGVLVHPHQTHICYLHSPPRFVWDLQADYFRNFGFNSGPKRWAASVIFHYLRARDQLAVNCVDHLVVNSRFVQRRTEKCYRRESDLIFPGVMTDVFTPGLGKSDYFLAGSFMNPFKRIDLAVKAFAKMPDKRLIVFGDGPQRVALEALATPNIEFVGNVSRARLVELMQGARAFVFSATEDFGIVMAEAQACGTPVLAYRRGGSADIIKSLADYDEPTGILFDSQTPESVVEAVDTFISNESKFSVAACRENSLRFSEEVFKKNFRDYVMARC